MVKSTLMVETLKIYCNNYFNTFYLCNVHKNYQKIMSRLMFDVNSNYVTMATRRVVTRHGKASRGWSRAIIRYPSARHLHSQIKPQLSEYLHISSPCTIRYTSFYIVKLPGHWRVACTSGAEDGSLE